MARKILLIGDRVAADDIENTLFPLGVDVIIETDAQKIERSCKEADIHLVIFDDDTFRQRDRDLYYKILKILQSSRKYFMIISSALSPQLALEALGLGASDYIAKPYSQREFIVRFNALVQRKIRIACIGGGTGLFHILMGLKELPDILLTSIVSMSDDGGSSGRLRASFGILPPGDIRRSLVALSNAPEIMNQLMLYRFNKGEGISGHSLGNLFLAALSEIKGSLAEATRIISDILNIQGIVLPVTNTPTTLCARFQDGIVVRSESKIDLAEGRSPNLHVTDIWHEPETDCNIDAFSSILFADFVIIGPGDLYTSVITNLLVKNMREAISRTRAKKIYVCNLMTKPGETANYTAYDHIKDVVKHMAGDFLDYIIISNTKLSDRGVNEYAKKDQAPVSMEDIDRIREITKAEVIIADVGHEKELVRHDSAKIRNEISKIVKRQASETGISNVSRVFKGF